MLTNNISTISFKFIHALSINETKNIAQNEKSK
jgi:hypothetical protein